MSYLIPCQPLVHQMPKRRLCMSPISLVICSTVFQTDVRTEISTSGNDIFTRQSRCSCLSVQRRRRRILLRLIGNVKRGGTVLSIRTSFTPEAPRHPHPTIHFDCHKLSLNIIHTFLYILVTSYYLLLRYMYGLSHMDLLKNQGRQESIRFTTSLQI